MCTQTLHLTHPYGHANQATLPPPLSGALQLFEAVGPLQHGIVQQAKAQQDTGQNGQVLPNGGVVAVGSPAGTPQPRGQALVVRRPQIKAQTCSSAVAQMS